MSSRNSPRFGIVASRFNLPITQSLLQSARSALQSHGVGSSFIHVRWVPGAFELAVAALQMAKSGRYAALIAVGCIVAGQTPQYRYLAQATYQGLTLAAVVTGVPVTCGVVVARNWQQAQARARKKGLNRGKEAAEAAWKMIHAR